MQMDSKDKVINDLLSRIAKLEYEVERLEKRNKEIYEGFMATTEELCEATKEIERLNEELKNKEEK
jgi:chaperonin cofactor prefoldin